jgi:hypothetical protein
MSLTPERRAMVSRAVREWRRRHPQKHAASMRRWRQVQRLRRHLQRLGVSERDLAPWLAELGREKRSRWRSRVRDCWDAWRLLVMQQHERCLACPNLLVDESPARGRRGELVGAVCKDCAKVYGARGAIT